MRAFLLALALAALGGCSACGSLQSASGPANTRLARAFELMAPSEQHIPGDDTRVEISGLVYWIEQDGPPPEAEAQVRVINLAA